MIIQDLQKLREQISTSAILSQTEKAEWMRLLLEMNDAQKVELASILESSNSNSRKSLKEIKDAHLTIFGPSPEASVKPPVVSTPILQKQQSVESPSSIKPAEPDAPKESKELPVQPEEQKLPQGVPIIALEKNVSNRVSAAPVIPVTQATPITPPAQSQGQPVRVIQQTSPQPHARPAWQIQITPKNMEPGINLPPAIPVVSAPPKNTAEMVAPEKIIQKPVPVEEPPSTPAPAAVIPEQSKQPALSSVQAPDDLTKLNLPFIRQADPKLLLANLLHAVDLMYKNHRITEIVGKIELSPLYKAYYATGLDSLNSVPLSDNPKPDELSKAEFEAFTDFRREMEQILS